MNGNVGGGAVGTDQPIDQLFLRCQPKPNQAKKARQKKKLNRSKAPVNGRSRQTAAAASAAVVVAAKVKSPKKSVAATSESDENTSCNPNSLHQLSSRAANTNSCNSASIKVNDSFETTIKTTTTKCKVSSVPERPTALNNTASKSSMHQSASSSVSLNANSKTKTSKYNASKNLQLQLKSSHVKKNDKNKLSKNSNKDSPVSDHQHQNTYLLKSLDEDELNSTCGIGELLGLSPSEELKETKNTKTNAKVKFKDESDLNEKSDSNETTNSKITIKQDEQTNKDKQSPTNSIIELESISLTPKGIRKSGSLPSIFKHHKLPNESSHYAISKDNVVSSNFLSSRTEKPATNKSPTETTDDPLIQLHIYSTDEQASNEDKSKAIESKISKSTDTGSIIEQKQQENNKPSHGPILHFSTLQFNALSDNESVVDETPSVRDTITRLSSLDLNSTSATKEEKPITNFVQFTENANSTNQNSRKDIEKPNTKTPLCFPKLDDGLSSEAESNNEESNDDDERAVDGDVDADDDEYEEEVEDNDDFDFDGEASSSIFSFLQSTDNLPRSSNSIKLQNRLTSSASLTNGVLQPNISSETVQYSGNNLKQNFTPSTYIDQDLQLKNDYYNTGPMNDLNNFNDQNGGGPSQTSSYWNQQSNQNLLRSGQNIEQRNKNNFNDLSKPNNAFARDETKSAIRLSSDTDNETDRLLGYQRREQIAKLPKGVNNLVYNNKSDNTTGNIIKKEKTNQREVLIEGVMFGVRFLGTAQLECGNRYDNKVLDNKGDKIRQAELAVGEVKSRNDPTMASQVQLFISTEKIMILDNERQKIATTFDLRTISYVADIGDAVVLIVRDCKKNIDPAPKSSCHVFESHESHDITKSISQAFQVAHADFLRKNGLDDNSYLNREHDLQEVLNSQEMSTEELTMFANKENHREVIVPKKKGEILGFSVVESGWGSMLPTVVIANLKQDGPAHRCKELSIGDQILSINGNSLVGLSLPECQEHIKRTRNQTAARLVVVPCGITVEVKIKRPDTKYQLGFSVQNGVIISLLRGGIAERGGVRVGHRIMSINGTPVVGVPHEKIVTMLASSVGEIRMKTCLTSLYRLMLGEDTPTHP